MRAFALVLLLAMLTTSTGLANSYVLCTPPRPLEICGQGRSAAVVELLPDTELALVQDVFGETRTGIEVGNEVTLELDEETVHSWFGRPDTGQAFVVFRDDGTVGAILSVLDDRVEVPDSSNHHWGLRYAVALALDEENCPPRAAGLVEPPLRGSTCSQGGCAQAQSTAPLLLLLVGVLGWRRRFTPGQR